MDVYPTKNVSIGIDPYPYHHFFDFTGNSRLNHGKVTAAFQDVAELEKLGRFGGESHPGPLFTVAGVDVCFF